MPLYTKHFLQICLHTQLWPEQVINRKGLPFPSQLACSTLNLLDGCAVSFLLLVRYTDCEQGWENRFRPSCATCTRLGTVEDGGTSVSSVSPFDPLARSTAERVTPNRQCITLYHSGYTQLGSWLYSKGFQDCRTEICTLSYDFTLLSVLGKEQWVPLGSCVLLFWKVRGNLTSQCFQSLCPSSTARTGDLRGINLGNLRPGTRSHYCRYEHTWDHV